MKNYKDLNRKELHKLFGRDISEYVFDWNEKQSEKEIRVARIIEKRFNVKLKHFPRVNSPDGIKTPDYASLKDSFIIEIKTVKSFEHGIEDAFKKARKQLSPYEKILNRFLVINIDIPLTYLNEILSEIKNKARELNFKFPYIVVINDDIVFLQERK